MFPSGRKNPANLFFPDEEIRGDESCHQAGLPRKRGPQIPLKLGAPCFRKGRSVKQGDYALSPLRLVTVASAPLGKTDENAAGPTAVSALLAGALPGPFLVFLLLGGPVILHFFLGKAAAFVSVHLGELFLRVGHEL